MYIIGLMATRVIRDSLVTLKDLLVFDFGIPYHQRGYKFDQETINAIFQKGTLVASTLTDEIRTDACGARMRKSHFGNVNSKYGWEIDHIKPTAKGGANVLSNMQPLQWQNNRAKGDGPMMCAISWNGQENAQITDKRNDSLLPRNTIEIRHPLF